MKNKKTIITFILIALLLISAIVVNIIALNGKNETKENNQVQTNLSTEVENLVENNTITEDLELTGEKYVAADVKDTSNNETKLETEENKPMILVFWNTSNENSTEALKVVQALYESYSDKVKFNCVAVIDEIDGDKEKIENFMSENNITIPLMYDDSVDNSLATANNVTKIPTILVINKNAEVINTLTDEINQDIVEANLDILTENY